MPVDMFLPGCCNSLYVPVYLQLEGGWAEAYALTQFSNGSKKKKVLIHLFSFLLLDGSDNFQAPYMPDRCAEVSLPL